MSKVVDNFLKYVAFDTQSAPDVSQVPSTEKQFALAKLLVEQMKVGAGITEELKASDQMKWVGLINNVRSSAEEIVMRELIYV